MLGVSPLEVTGLWTAPICRTLLQVAPLGAEMHWQARALIDGILERAGPSVPRGG